MSDKSMIPATATATESLDDAAKSFEALLSVEETPEKQPRKKQPVAQEAPAPTEDEGEELEAAETAPEGEPESAEAASSTDATDEEAEGEAQEEEPVYTVKVDGKEMEVPLGELLNGYSRTADYTRKTEALAQERKSFHGEIEQVRTERSQYAQLLPALAAQLQSSLPPAPDLALRETDPITYVIQKDRHEEAVGRLSAAFSELQRVQQVQQSEELRALEQQVAANFEKLPDLIPAWKDTKAYERDKPKLREYLQKTGYSAEEVDRAYDHRAVALAWKAMRYDELLARKPPRPDAPIEKVVRPTPPAAVPQARQVKESQAARRRLAETGKVEDAAAAIRALL